MTGWKQGDARTERIFESRRIFSYWRFCGARSLVKLFGAMGSCSVEGTDLPLKPDEK